MVHRDAHRPAEMRLVCDEWQSFDQFRRDVPPLLNSSSVLCMVDADFGYCPGLADAWPHLDSITERLCEIHGPADAMAIVAEFRAAAGAPNPSITLGQGDLRLSNRRIDHAQYHTHAFFQLLVGVDRDGEDFFGRQEFRVTIFTAANPFPVDQVPRLFGEHKTSGQKTNESWVFGTRLIGRRHEITFQNR